MGFGVSVDGQATSDRAQEIARLGGLSMEAILNAVAAAQLSGQSVTITATKTSAYTAAAGDLVPVDATGGAVTITLPIAPAVGTRIAVKKTDSSANAVSIARGGSDTINGGTSAVSLTLQGHAAVLRYGSSGWITEANDLPYGSLKTDLNATYVRTVNSAGPDGSGNVTVAGGGGSVAFQERGAWATSTSYAVGDVVTQAGQRYACRTSHTSGTFSTDLTASKWVLLDALAVGTTSGTVAAGNDSRITGALQASNNLSDVTAATARTNLGLGTAATISTTAGGDLSGSLPSPTVAKVNGVAVTGTPTSGQVLTASSGTAAAWANPGSGADKLGLTPTAVKTSAYTAAVGDLVPVDTTGGAVTITLPTAPADGSVIAVKQVIRGGTNTVTIARGGSDVFNQASGGTSLTLTLSGQAALLQYKASGAIWYVVAADLPLAQLDARFTGGGGTGNPTAKTSGYTAVAGDFVLANAVSAGFTVTLPASPTAGQQVGVVKTDASSNVVTVVATSKTINGDANATIVTRWAGAVFEYDGSNWFIAAVCHQTGGSSTGIDGGSASSTYGGTTAIDGGLAA